MKTEKSFEELEREWEKITERLKTIQLPGFGKNGFDASNYRLLQRMSRSNPEVRAAVQRVIPELTVHPFFSFPTAELETFSVAAPQAGPGTYLELAHATHVDAGVSAHFDNGIAAFHSELMGNLGTEFPPAVTLNYLFPESAVDRVGTAKEHLWTDSLN